MKKIIIFSATFFGLMSFFVASPAQATVFFHYDAEGGVPGAYLPGGVKDPSLTGEAFYPLGWKEGNSVVRGTIENKAPTPDGNNYINFRIPLNENTATHQAKHKTNFSNYSITEDGVLYVAYYHNAKSVNGSDIWRESGQSVSKSIGLDLSGTRWSNSFGHWTEPVGEKSA